jgi:flagella basal body P-ring formation protein FlgA
MILLAAFAMAGCVAVGAGSDHVTAGDVAPALSGFAEIAPETPLALAPAPGVVRVFHAPELRRIAARIHATAGEASEVCVTRPVAPLDPVRLADAMRLLLPEGRIEIIDYSRIPVPEGELDFERSGLRQVSGSGFWSGAVRYGGGHRFAIWAKVKISVAAVRVVAAVNLKAAHPVLASDLRVERSDGFPDSGVYVNSIEAARGRVLRRPVTAGTPLRAMWLDEPKDVARGETVRVEVWNGGAHLELEAEAEASGSTGDTIPVRNTISNRRFPARVEGKGRVSIGKANQQ